MRSTINAAIDFESSFAGVRKTVDATEPQLQALARGFRELSTEIPISVNELNRIGEAAGQLGIQRGAILSFTETVAQLGITTNLAADQAATALAQIANITGIPQDQFDQLGSTVVDLGNKLAATESDIVDFGLRIAAAGRIVGLSVDQTLAIAGAFRSVGVEAEAGGTAVSKVFIALANAVQTGGKKLEVFAETAGTSTAQFRRAFERDAAGAFSAFIDGLRRVDKEGGNVFKTLTDLGLTDQRLTRAFLSISQSADGVSKALGIGKKAWQENTALTIEAEKRYATAASRLQVFKNRVNDLQITLGAALVPALEDIIAPLSEWINKTENQQRAQKALTDIVGDAREVIAGVRDVVVPLSQAAGVLTEKLGGLRRTVELLLIAMVASKVVGFATSITGLGTAAVGTTGRVNALRFALLRLGAIGVIAVGIEVILNRKAIHDKVTGFLEKHAPFLVPDGLDIPLGIDAKSLKVVRDRLAEIKGEGDATVVILDRVIKALIKAGRTGFPKNVTAASLHEERPTSGGLSGKTLKIVKQTTESLAANAKLGDAIIAKITGQVAAQEDLNRQLRDSVTRAAHLRDLIRADPANGQLRQRLSAELTKQADLQVQIANAAEETAASARAQLIAVLDLRAAQAGLTKSLQDDLRISRDREQTLTRLRNLNRDDLDIAQQLVGATADRRDIEQQIAQNKRDQRQASQFELLGLTATGEKKAPGIQALLGRSESLENQVKGTFLDTAATSKKFAGIAKVLAQGPKAVGREMRLAILQMFNEIAGALKDGSEAAGKNLTAHRITDPNKILEGLGLTPEQQRQMRARLISQSASGNFRTTPGQGAFGFSKFGAPGAGDPAAGFGGGLGAAMIFSGPITVISNDPDEMGRKLGKKARRAVKSRGGRFAGNRGL